MSELPRFITHYFEKETGPFQSICDLSHDKIAELIERQCGEEMGFNRYAEGPEFFLKFRFLADELLLQAYQETFRLTPQRRPYFAVLGEADVVAGMFRDPYKIQLDIDFFDETELTFMVPDHAHLISYTKAEMKPSFGFQLPADYSPETMPYFGKLFTYRELTEKFDSFGIRAFLNEQRIANNWYRYIEAQIWTSRVVEAYGPASWVEAEPEPWTWGGITRLQNYKKLRK